MGKSFKDVVKADNPALAFLTVENEPESGNEARAKREKRPSAANGEAKRRERKTAHVHLLMTPSLHAAGTKAAEEEGVSFSALLTRLLEEHIDGMEG